MKYLVDKKTKEHRPYFGGSIEWAEDQGLDIVRADSEGWIPHTGTECPLPGDCMVEIRFNDEKVSLQAHNADQWSWNRTNSFADITHYRPILAEPEKVQEPEPVVKDSLTTDLLDRLKAAHETAQQIPDLEAELRGVLATMGYDLVARNPFVELEQGNKYAAEWQLQRHGAQENNNEI